MEYVSLKQYLKNRVLSKDHKEFFLFRTMNQISVGHNLPGGIAAALQVRSNLGVGSDTVEEGHHFRVAAEHRLVLPEHVLHTTVEHHITPHHLKNWKKEDKIGYIWRCLIFIEDY